MAGLVPAIHAFLRAKQDVDARHKAGHDVDRITPTNGAGVSALQTEAELSPKPRAKCSKCAGRDPATVRLLMPDAVAS